ncbi:MAG TPA: hypothetical protein VFO94_10510, partial [Gammaproteobacteria bacterium]|nr:hypothetical protein [Gammaproteobacteria bacterium]
MNVRWAPRALAALAGVTAVLHAAAQPAPRGVAAEPGAVDPATLRVEHGLCTASAPLRDAGPKWNGWGP